MSAIAVAISVATVGLVLRAGEGQAEEIASAGALSFLADEKDARILLDRLNADQEIAFIVPDGPRMPPPSELMPPSPAIGDRPRMGSALAFASCSWSSNGYWQRWRAQRPVDGITDGEQLLWHISAGPLLVSDNGSGRRRWQPDPWAGWTSERPVCRPNLMPAATIRLNLVTRYAGYTAEELTTIRPLISYWIKGDLLVASDFQWSGASLQPGGSLQTARWATYLDEWFSRNAVRLQAPHSDQAFWAFPSALQRLKAGLRYDARGFDLDESIRQAR